MQISKEVTEILDYLCKKFGVEEQCSVGYISKVGYH